MSALCGHEPTPDWLAMSEFEHRRVPRQRALLGARIIFNQRCSTLDCVVRNMSEMGAMLVVPDTVLLPATFDLEIAQKQRTYHAVVRWRDETRIGVSFESTIEAANSAAGDIADRLKHEKQENERLRHRILQLTETG